MQEKQFYTTKETAETLGVAVGTIHNATGKFGAYRGVVPVKHFSGRLSWPADAVDALKEAHLLAQAKGAQK